MATVLIIDGDVAVAQTLKDALAASGVHSIVTGDGTEGLGLAKADPPDVIVLCVELSRVSGYSICNKLKKDPSLAGVPLVLTSSQATEETFEQHKKLRTRADAYLKKPFEIDAFLGILGEYFPLQGAAARVDDPGADVDIGESAELGDVDDDLSSVADGAAVASAGDDGVDEAPRSRPRGSASAKSRSYSDDLDDLLEAAPSPSAGGRRRPSTPPSGGVDDGPLAGDDDEVAPAARARVAARERPDVSVDADDAAFGEPAGVLGGAHDGPSPARSRAPASAASRRPAASRPARSRSASSAGAPATDAAADQLRAESTKLRLRVKELEQTLHDKELEFNDRLLQESTRSREGIELKKKIVQLEREVGKHQQAEERARAEAAGFRDELERMREEVGAVDAEKQNLSDKLGQLVDKVKTLAAERDDLSAEVEAERAARGEAEQAVEQAAAVRQKAKKAVDIAVQLIDETGLA
jgi:CheY-like chemotaxis protein